MTRFILGFLILVVLYFLIVQAIWILFSIKKPTQVILPKEKLFAEEIPFAEEVKDIPFAEEIKDADYHSQK